MFCDFDTYTILCFFNIPIQASMFVCVEVLSPSQPSGLCLARSVYLTTRLLGRLSPLSGFPVLCTFFRQKLTTVLLESAEGRQWPKKIFHDQSPRKNVADLGGGWTRALLVSSQTAHPTEPPRPATSINLLTPAMLNKLRCRALIWFSANKITCDTNSHT